MGDPSGKFTEALDLSFDSAAIFGNNRSKRYVLLVEDGKVKETFIEPDNTGLNGKLRSSVGISSYANIERKSPLPKRCSVKPIYMSRFSTLENNRATCDNTARLQIHV